MNWISYRKQLLFNEKLEKKRFIVACKKLIEKVPNSNKAKEHESFLRKENRKSVKQSEIMTNKPNTFDNVDKKSDIAKYPKTSHKLPKTISKGEKVGSNNSLYSKRTKSENAWSKKI